MAYTAEHGPPDVDGTHAWTPFVGTPPPVLNDQSTWPRTRFMPDGDAITGFRALPESDDNREPRTNFDGEVGYPGRKVGKTLAYEMEVVSDSLQGLRFVQTGILNGFQDMSRLGLMTITPFAYIGGVVWQYKARVLSCEFDAKPVWDERAIDLIGGGRMAAWTWPFHLSLRMLDPFFYTPTYGTGTASL